MRLRASPVARFLETTVYETETGQVNLLWQRKAEELAQVERSDGRYLLVTNDWSLSHAEMFRLYRQKDGVETCFHIGKADLQISPLYLHQDERISAMLFLNMVALLVYNLLQRQIRNQGLQMTTRRLMQRLDSLSVSSPVYMIAHVQVTPINPLQSFESESQLSQVQCFLIKTQAQLQ